MDWRIEGISLTQRKTNEEVLSTEQENKILLKTVKYRRGKIFGHLIRHDSFLRNTIEAKIEGEKRGTGRPRRRRRSDK